MNYGKFNSEINKSICIFTKEEYKFSNEDTFYDWFRGFCDAESNFTIRLRKRNNKLSGFEFLFRITLHTDDLGTLKLIQEKLNCGKIRKDRNTYVLIISSLKDIETVILPLFEEYPLMTKKYLDYLAFRKSFIIFKKRQIDKDNKQNYDSQILELKNSMNDKRVNFSLPENHIKITDNYLLGYIEGDGSFFFNKSDNTVRISLITITEDRFLLEKIKEYLINQLDEYSLILAKNTKLIFINNKKARGNTKPVTELVISQIDFICNYLISFFDNLEFRTKKKLDYLDFKRIAYLILDGKHLTEKGRNIIIKLADTMNNSRLSTNINKSPIENLNLKLELELLEKSKPLIRINSEGRALWISKKRWIRTTLIIKAVLPGGKIKYYPSGVSCANDFSVSNSTIMKRLNDKEPLIRNKEEVLAIMLERIRVYRKI